RSTLPRSGEPREPAARVRPAEPPGGVDQDRFHFRLVVGGKRLMPGPEVEYAAFAPVPDAPGAEMVARPPGRLEHHKVWRGNAERFVVELLPQDPEVADALRDRV